MSGYWPLGGTTSVNLPKCSYCGGYPHDGFLCPRIEEIEYHESGGVKRVKLRSLAEGVLDRGDPASDGSGASA